MLTSINSLGLLLKVKGDLAAEPLYREVFEGRRETPGDGHPSTLASTNKVTSPWIHAVVQESDP